MSSPLRTIVAILVLALLAGCGYRNTLSGPVALPEDKRKLFFEEVENPTLRTSLDARLRSLIRDELTRRGKVEWVSRDQAEAYFQIEILQFTSTSSVTGAEEQTLRFTTVISLEGGIVSAADRSILWSSGPVSAYESFLSGGRDAAEDRVILLAVERVVDRLGHSF